jgi:hypothetical protein
MLAIAPSRPAIEAYPAGRTILDWSMTQRKTRKAKSGPRSGRRRRLPAGGWRRWLLLPIALGLGGLAFYVLLTEGSVGSVARGPAPLDRIDDASREQLERLIEDAERAEANPR